MADQQDAPSLDELRRELQAVGMVVVPFGDEIHIRRSTLEYIKVKVDNGVLRCEPWIGVMSQTRATWALLAAEMILIVGLQLEPNLAAQGLAIAFGGILAFGLHTLRYTLSEVMINRVQSVWLDLRNRHRTMQGATPAPLSAPSAGALTEGSAPVREQSAVHPIGARRARE